MRLRPLLILVLCVWITLTSLRSSSGSPGDAEVTRTKNQQYFQLEPGDIDVTRYRNLEFFQLEPGNIDAIRLRNLQYFQLEQGDADAIRYRNLQFFQLEQNDADVVRVKNLQFFEMTEVGTLVINIGPILITDQDGNAKTTFLRGDTIQIRFVVANVGMLKLSRGLIYTVVLDPSSVPIFLTYTFEDLASGASKQYINGYRIPLDGQIGTYTVKVTVYTNWPSWGGEGLDIETSTFTVTS